MNTTSTSHSTAWQRIVAAARANIVPGLILQAVALVIVVAYFRSATVHTAFDRVAALKQEVGMPFAMVSTALCAGVFPLLLQGLQRQVPGQVARRREGISALPFYLVYWAIIGATVDALYLFLARLFGDNNLPLTVIKKVSFDEFLFTPIVLGFYVICCTWKDSGYSTTRARQVLSDGKFVRRWWPMLIAAWIVWIPAVAMVYCLPQPLQLPVNNVIMCMWAMILLFLQAPTESAEPPVIEPLASLVEPAC
jgi:hypothetical protein